MLAMYVKGKGKDDFILSANGGYQIVNKNLMNAFMYAQRLEENPEDWPKDGDWIEDQGTRVILKAAEGLGRPLAFLTNELDFVSIDFEAYRERMKHYTAEEKGAAKLDA